MFEAFGSALTLSPQLFFLREFRMYYDIIESPICRVLLAGDEEGLKHVIFLKGEKHVETPDNWV
ncbi:MAG: methylated-DNA-[protein]-cysteine S-methyltransferase, partial [Euryarchaeota archaeon]|nr:methylated-DNA-[protein]-cysteine S-methyltransferase [Euryarchaeota archaeon]